MGDIEMGDTEPGVMAGLKAAVRGLKLAAHAPEVRRAYLQLAVVILALAVALDGVGIWAVVHYMDAGGDGSWWTAAAWLLLRIASIGLVLIVAPVLAVFAVDLLFPLLGERVFYAGMRLVSPERAAALLAREGTPLVPGMVAPLLRLLRYLGASTIAFAISFVPIAGAILAPVLQLYFTARALGWELLDPYFDKLGVRFAAQRQFVGEHRPTLLGFALPYACMFAIPLVGPLAFGIAQAAAGVLVAERLDPLVESGRGWETRGP